MPSPNPLRTKKYWRNMTLAIVATVLITVIFTSQIVNVQANGNQNNDWYEPGSYTQDVMSESIVVNPQGCFFTGFIVPDDAQNAFLHGNYSVIPNHNTNNAVTINIWRQQEFIKYLNNENSKPCYNIEFFPMRSDDFNVSVSSGQYIILIGGGSIVPDTLHAEICLDFTIPPR